MQFYDVVMLIVMGGSILFGFWKGFAWQVASLASIVISYFVARNFNGPVAEMIGGDPSWNRFLAMFILFMGTSLVIWLAFGFVRNTIERLALKGFDRQVGAALGAVKGFVLATVITLFAVSLLGDKTTQAICTSKSGNYIARVLSHMGGLVPDELGKHINPYIDEFKGKIEQHNDDEVGPDGLLPNGLLPGGLLPGNELNQWTNGGNTETIGQLQSPNVQQSNQPVFNASSQRWEFPNQQNQANQPTQSWQPPQEWRDTANDIIREGTQRLGEEAWRRAMGGNQ